MKSITVLAVFAAVALYVQATMPGGSSGMGSMIPTTGNGMTPSSSGSGSPSSGSGMPSPPSSGSGSGPSSGMPSSGTPSSGSSSGMPSSGMPSSMMPSSMMPPMMASNSSTAPEAEVTTAATPVDPCDIRANEPCDSIINDFGIEAVYEVVNWPTANKNCIAKGKKLVKVDFNRKFDCIRQLDNQTNFWIGLLYNKNDKIFRWTTTDETLNENCTFWNNREPNYSGECVQLYAKGGSKWDDTYCQNTKRDYLCENK